MNANMNHKSAIQIIAEMLVVKEAFKNNLIMLNDHYTINDNVFVCDARGNAQELKEGYYSEVATFDTIEEAMEDFNIMCQGFRIHDGKFSVGNLSMVLSEAEGTIIDLEAGKIL